MSLKIGRISDLQKNVGIWQHSDSNSVTSLLPHLHFIRGWSCDRTLFLCLMFFLCL